MNKIKASVVFAVIGVLLSLILSVSCIEIEACRGIDLDKDEHTMMSVKECLNASNANSFTEVSAEQMSCFGKCVMMKKGIIDENGLPHKENTIKLVTDKMPKVVHDDLIKRMETCLEEETNMIDPKEETCNTYVPLGMCIHLAYLEECDKED